MYVMCVNMVMEQVCQQFQEIMEEEECDDETLCVTLTVEMEQCSATPSTRRSFRLSSRRAGVHHRYQSSVNSNCSAKCSKDIVSKKKLYIKVPHMP